MQSPWLRLACGLALVASAANALKFELTATSAHDTRRERCVRNFVSKDTLVVVTAIVDGYKGDGMSVNMHVRDSRNPPETPLPSARCPHVFDGGRENSPLETRNIESGAD